MVKSKKAALKLARKSAQAGPKHVKNNPFEIHTNKRKHDILGRKLKHDRGLPGISRSKAIKKVSSYGVFFKAWAILEYPATYLRFIEWEIQKQKDPFIAMLRSSQVFYSLAFKQV